MTSNKTCRAANCNRLAEIKGLCRGHYNYRYAVRRRRKNVLKLKELRYGKGHLQPREEYTGTYKDFVQYSYESQRWRDAQRAIADYLRRFGQGEILWAQPPWGTNSEEYDPALRLDRMLELGIAKSPRSLKIPSPWSELPITSKVLATCRTCANTIVNGVRWELIKAQELVPSPVSEDLMAYKKQVLEEWG